MAERAELEQTHCVVAKVFAFTVPPLGSADGFKASLWPKQPIWVGRLRVVSRGGKCAILLEHTDKEGLFASCPIQNAQTVEAAIDSSRYFVLRLSDGKGRHALIGIGFNDRAQAFDFKVSLQDWENQQKEPVFVEGPKGDYSIPQGGSIHVNMGSAAAASAEKEKKKKRGSGGPELAAGFEGLKLDGPPGKGADDGKEKKKKKKKDKDVDQPAPSAAAAQVVGAGAATSNIIDFGFGDFDPLNTPKQQPPASSAPRRASIDPFSGAAPSFGANGTNATPFDTPFDDTPADWVKF